MLGFIFKVLIIAAVVGSVGYVVYTHKGGIPTADDLKSELSQTVKEVDIKSLSQNVSSSLDALVVNQQSQSPVVLGVKISNDTISKIVDALQGLPPEQLNQVKQAICAPIVATPTGSVLP